MDQPVAVLSLSGVALGSPSSPSNRWIASEIWNGSNAAPSRGCEAHGMPVTGETYLALSAVTPDVSFVHVQTRIPTAIAASTGRAGE